jgi:hypothetical protein
MQELGGKTVVIPDGRGGIGLATTLFAEHGGLGTELSHE